MSTKAVGTEISVVAAADLSAAQYKFVKIDNTGKLALCVLGDLPIGVLQNKPAAGVVATVRISGVTKVLAGGSITAGDRLTSNASGAAAVANKGTVNTSDAGAAADATIGSNVAGIALMGGSANDIISMCIQPAGLTPTTQS